MTGVAFEADLAAWAEEQAQALAEGRLDDLDHPHLAGLLRDLGDRDRQEVRDRLGVILTGLLRWAVQVDLRCHGWAVTIGTQRRRVLRLLRDSPSLRSALPDLIATVYPEAKARAVLESALFDDSFSESCPFSEAEIFDESWLPDPHGDDLVRGAGWWQREVIR
ncbi:DUF29 domain-containing protein [Methylobacterium oryzihabitans]|uniref:DUF29 domain-containing protein n=1 Tax=Methylobacterium oryzihabitans TaxID=2499852 RepID=A0A3S2W034_9HYPH|nr:DUF29 domain-containing protein [Methylobacterium oryzihabitans]RVU21864.1 DUF29 domain-containing protein [Methylobacterium oryzihabitans]